MGIKARAEYTVSVVNDGKGERTYIRYSDDNGKTFTKEKPFVEETPLFEKADDTVSTNKSKTKPVGANIAKIPLAGFTTGSVYTLSLDYKFDEKAEKAEVVIFSAKWKNVLHFTLDKSIDFSHSSFAFTLPNFARDGNYFYARLDNIEAVTESVDGSVLARNVRIEKGGVEYPNFVGRNLAKGTLNFSGAWNFAGAGELTTEKHNGLSVLMQDGNWNQRGAVVSCKAGRVYTFSFFAKVDTEIPINCRWVLRNVEDKDYIVTGGLTKYEQFTTEWKRYSVTIKFLKDCPNAAFSVEKKDNGSKMWLCGYKIEYGDKATEYSPAPEDLQFGLTTGKFIGIVSWDKNYPPLNPNAYTWSEFKGQDAEMYKLNPLEESAVVGEYGECNIDLQYEIKHVVGNKEAKYTGNDITISVDNRVNEIMFMKAPAGSWECRMAIVDFTKKNLGSFSVNIMKGQQVLDTRVVPVTYNTNVILEASQKLGAIIASVKGVSKLIHNMFVGSTFLESIEGAWSMAGAAVDKGVKYNNSNAVLIQNSGATQDSYHGVYFFVEGLIPKKKYTISAMVCTDNLKGMDEGAAIEIKMTDNGQDIRLCDPFKITPTKENEWQNVEFTFTAPDRISSEKVQVRFQLWRNGHLWISQPMMNQGEVAADYTANIKDIQLSLAQIKLTANTISQSVTDLNTGLESVGIHLNGAEKKITLHGDTEMVDANGKRVAMFKDGKIITEAIDVDKVMADGIQGKTIDAKNATFENVNIKGGLDSVSGTFKRLKCVDGNGNVVAVLRFGEHGALTIEGGDLFMQGTKDGRSLRFYTSDIWCRGMFGHTARTCAVIKNDIMHVYVGEKGKDGEKGVKVKLSTAKLASGETVYRIPMYSPGTGYYADELFGTLVNSNDPKLSGVPIDVIVFNCTANFLYTFVLLDKGKTWTVINGNSVQTVKIVDIGGWRELAGGTASNYFYVAPEWLYPYQSNTNKLGRGVFYAGSWDMNWT